MVHARDGATHGARTWNPRRTITPGVAAMLANARRRGGWSLRQAARRAKVTPGTIVHLEKARRAPSDVVAENIIYGYRLGAAEAEMLRSEAVSDAGKSSPWKARL
jgi:transcriptional regulator with XRE-family HTH domain